MFFYGGLINQILLISAVYLVAKHRHQRANPIGIIFNIVIVQIIHQMRIFLSGLFFQIW